MKRLRFENGDLDAVDAQILDILDGDGRVSVADLARAIKLSPPSTTERIDASRKLV